MDVHPGCIKMRWDSLNARNVLLDIIVMLAISVMWPITRCRKIVLLGITVRMEPCGELHSLALLERTVIEKI